MPLISSHYEIVFAASGWWESHSPIIDLLQEGDTLCWYLMWGQDPPPYAQLLVCLYVLFLPYVDDIVVSFMGLYGQRMSSVYVPHGLELLPVFHDTCFRCSTASTMFISVEFFTPDGLDYVHIMLTLEEKYTGNWLIEHLAYDGDFILHDTMDGGEEVLQLLPYQFLEDKQHLGGEDCDIPT